MIGVIEVEMLGGLWIWEDGRPVLEDAAGDDAALQVFCYLLLNRDAPISAFRLARILWPNEETEDCEGVLKTAVARLNGLFEGAQNTGEDVIVFDGEGYQCNEDIRFMLDVETFVEKLNLAQNAEGEEQQELLGEAMDAYKGELLPRFSAGKWTVPLADFYKQRFDNAARQLLQALYEEKEYNRLLAAATQAVQVDPLEEEYYLYMFRALYQLQMYRAIIPAFTKMVRVFAEELGQGPGEEIREIFVAASKRVDSVEQDIMIIRGDLREMSEEGGAAGGPMYCSYDVFKYMYQMLARSSERSGGSVVVLLLTLRGKGGGELPAKTLSVGMSQIKALISKGLLRKSDTVARYSQNQYLVMLSIDKSGSAQQVIDRLQQQGAPILDSYGIEMVFATAEIEHAR